MWTRLKALTLLCTLPLLFACASKSIPFRIEGTSSVDDPQFTRTVGNLFSTPLITGNKVETLVNGDQIFPAMLDAVRNAKKTINLETYIYWSGNIGQQFTDALVERASHGVHVNVMIDSYGSAKIDHGYIKQLKSAGAEFYQYHPFHFYDIASFREIDHRTHRKILVVDGNLGFIGGVGIADEWTGNAQDPKHWRDTHYRVTGPVVADLQAAFMENWIQTTGEVLGGEDYFPALHETGTMPAQIFKSSYQSGSESMQLLFLLSIASARKTVHMESAYFVPDTLTRQYLIEAAKRGVDVEIIVPGRHIDEKIVRVASRARWGDLLKAGVKIYEYQGTMFHCKQMIIDGEWVSIGSANLDNRSFRLNDEANINVIDAPFARVQEDLFTHDRAHAGEITYEQWKHRGPFETLLDTLFTTAGSEM